MKLFFFLLPAFFLGLFSASPVTEPAIKGMVYDNESKEPLVGATVRVLQSEKTILGALADIDGIFMIQTLEPGNYDIQVSYTGYETMIMKDVKVEAGRPLVLDFGLKSATTLNEVIVTGYSISLVKSESKSEMAGSCSCRQTRYIGQRRQYSRFA
ncbi:MAG: carboxypeptidase-like regulatory domain-containing protein [Lewinellaceae bacterium]|nr:carboxypeptidase-like regulatory domain-containing protein [Lewinellaceae bacterium]